MSIILFLIAVAFFIYAQSNDLKNNSHIISEVCFENKCFDVEIADTPKEKEMGLMSREYLKSNRGMLFVFEKESVYNFWMKNVLIPLDMIWIDESNKIVFMKENAEPCETEQCEIFGSDKKAKYVLEVNGGLAEKTGVKTGDEIKFK